MRAPLTTAFACTLGLALVAGCGGTGSSAKPVSPPSPRSSPAATAPTATTTATLVVRRAHAPATAATTAPSAPPSSAPPATAAVVAAAPTAQRIVVSAAGYGGTTATLSAAELVAGHWRTVFGPWTAHVGRNGFAPPGSKHEGDGRSPTGTFGFSFFFGLNPNPGVRFEYRHITSSAIVWDDDPASSNYNEWIDTRVAPAGNNPEPMYNAPVYDYGAVIAYNTARVPGRGSAIFLAVAHGAPTAGCVALPEAELLSVLRWLDRRLAPTITMGVGVT